MRRFLLPLVAVLACLPGLLPVRAEAAAAPKHWANAEIRAVVGAGLMAPSAAAFRPDATLTRGEAAELVAGLTEQPRATVADAGTPVTMAGLNAQLVKALGLQDTATQFARTARAAGLRPPARFGTEVVARLLGLRKNHPPRAATSSNVSRTTRPAGRRPPIRSRASSTSPTGSSIARGKPQQRSRCPS